MEKQDKRTLTWIFLLMICVPGTVYITVSFVFNTNRVASISTLLPFSTVLSYRRKKCRLVNPPPYLFGNYLFGDYMQQDWSYNISCIHNFYNNAVFLCSTFCIVF